MTSSFGTHTARQCTLGALLRRLRKDAKLFGQVLAGQLGVSQSHLSRVELAAAAATRELVTGWLDETDAVDLDRATALDMVEAVVAEFGSWREALAGGLVKVQRESLAPRPRRPSTLNMRPCSSPVCCRRRSTPIM